MILPRSTLLLKNSYNTLRYAPLISRISSLRKMASIVSDVKEVEVMDDSELKDGEK